MLASSLCVELPGLDDEGGEEGGTGEELLGVIAGLRLLIFHLFI